MGDLKSSLYLTYAFCRAKPRNSEKPSRIFLFPVGHEVTKTNSLDIDVIRPD